MAYIKLKDPTAFIVKKQVIRVEKLVGQKNKFKEVAFKKKIKLTESLRREETEESLEKYKDRGIKIKGFSIPRLGFLDSIKNFLFSVLFGALALKLLPYLPQLKGVLITTLKIGNFAIEFAGTILNAMVTFIDKVYGIIDFGKQQAKILGGDSGVKNYEKMLGMSNKVINTMLIAGMLFSDLISLKAQADSNQNAVGEIGQTVAEEIKKRQGFRASIQAAGRVIGGVAKSAGIVLLVGLASSLLGELSFQQRKFTKKLENDVAYQLKKAERDPNPITRALKLVTYNAALPGLRYFNFVSTGVGTLLDIIGAPFRYLGELVNLGIMSLTGDASGIKKQRENLGKLDARIREQIREVVNTLSLGTLAKEKGSFGSLYGSSATTAMGYASGGAVTREGQEAIGGVITRTGGKKAISRTLEIPMSPLNPGSSVGGQLNYIDPDTKEQKKSSNIETFFPNPKDSKYINSYQYLTGSYNVVSSGEFLKPFLQMPIKIIMGNGSSEGDYNSLASSVNSLFVTILRRTLVPGARKSLADELGFVDIFSWARDSIRVSMIDPVNEILKSLKEQFMLKSGDGPGLVKDAAAGSGGASDGGGGAEAGGIQDASISAGEMDLFTRMVYAEAGGEGKTGMSLVARAILNRAGLIQSGKVRPGTFNARSGSITDVIKAPVQFSPMTDGRINQKLSDSQISQAKDAITLAQNPAQLMSALKSEGLDDASIKKLVASTGFRNKSVARYDASQDVNEVNYKRHTFNTAGNRALAVPQAVAISKEGSIAGESKGSQGKTSEAANRLLKEFPQIKTKSNPQQIYASGLGFWLKKNFNVPADDGMKPGGRGDYADPPGAPYGGMESPDHGGVVASHRGRGHYLGKALDLGANGGRLGTDQDKLFPYVQKFLNTYGLNNSKTFPQTLHATGETYSPVGPRGGPDGGHNDHLHVEFKEGGPVNKTDYALTHPGEYVVDADSVKLFGIQFYDIINKVEMVSQRKNASIKLISILSEYTEDGFVNKDHYTYKFLPPEVITIPGPGFEIASSSGFGGGGGGDDDPSKDGLEQR